MGAGVESDTVKSIGAVPVAGSLACASLTLMFGGAWTGVSVGLLVPATSGSSVKTVVKFVPEILPWLDTFGPPRYGLLIVTWNMMVTEAPARSVPILIGPALTSGLIIGRGNLMLCLFPCCPVVCWIGVETKLWRVEYRKALPLSVFGLARLTEAVPPA